MSSKLSIIMKTAHPGSAARYCESIGRIRQAGAIRQTRVHGKRLAHALAPSPDRFCSNLLLAYTKGNRTHAGQLARVRIAEVRASVDWHFGKGERAVARKRESACFLHLQNMAQCACSAGQAIQRALLGAQPFHTANERLSEQQALAQREWQTLLHALLHAFITPMEREDLCQISQTLMALLRSLCTWGTALELLDGRALRALLTREATQVQAVLAAVEQVMQALPSFSRPQSPLSTRLWALQKQLQRTRLQAPAALRQWAARPMDAKKLHLYALDQTVQRVYECAWQVYMCVQRAAIHNV